MNTQAQTKSALELAEDILVRISNWEQFNMQAVNEALAAIQKEKEAPKQEPVAWVGTINGKIDWGNYPFASDKNDIALFHDSESDGFTYGAIPLYTSPQPQPKLSQWRSVVPKKYVVALTGLSGCAYNQAIDEITAALERLERGE